MTGTEWVLCHDRDLDLRLELDVTLVCFSFQGSTEPSTLPAMTPASLSVLVPVMMMIMMIMMMIMMMMMSGNVSHPGAQSRPHS